MKLILINKVTMRPPQMRDAAFDFDKVLGEVGSAALQSAYHKPFRFNALRGDFFAEVGLVVLSTRLTGESLADLRLLAADKTYGACKVVAVVAGAAGFCPTTHVAKQARHAGIETTTPLNLPALFIDAGVEYAQCKT